MIGNLLSKFPDGYTPRNEQAKLINQIDAAFNEGYEYVMVGAPTGSGKSLLSKTIANNSTEPSDAFKDLIESYEAFKKTKAGGYVYEEECKEELPAGTFALTITKALQDQYKELFPDTSILKGKANYQSTIDPTIDVELESIIMPKKILEAHRLAGKCPYHNDRAAVLTSQFAALNYKMFLSLPDHVKYKEYLICDEASELEDEIVKQFSVAIDLQRLRKMGIKVSSLRSTKPTNVKAWLNEIQINVTDCLMNLYELARSKRGGLTRAETGRLKYLKNFHRSIVLIDKTWNKCEYIVQIDNIDNIRLTPLKVDTLSSFIFKYAEKILLMSATIIDHKNLAKTLGIKKYKYIEAPSTFNAAKSPIYISQTNRLNHSNLVKAMPSIVKQIQQICDQHKDEKGIIHTHTNFITSYIKNHIDDPRFLYRDDEAKNEQILEIHSNTPDPTVLVSPSLGLGVDLKDDLARFQIVVKAAYLPLGDNRIKKMFDLDKQWYADKMLSNFIQQCGRGVRSEDDHCVTYVLDATIFDAIMRNRDKLPKYFLDRFV